MTVKRAGRFVYIYFFLQWGVMFNVSFDQNRSQFSCFQESQSMSGKHSVTLLYVSVATSVVTIVLTLTSTFGNALVILAVWKKSTLRTPSNILLCCLAFTDLLNAAITQPSFVAYNIARIRGNVKVYCNASAVAIVLGTCLCGISFLTLTGVSLDRYLALNLHLRYKVLIRRRTIAKGVITCWILGFICYVVPPIFGWYLIWNTLETIIIAVSLLINALLYFSIFCLVHRHELKLKSEIKLCTRLHGHLRAKIKKYRRRSWTVVYVCILYAFCYAPYVASLVWTTVTSGKPVTTNARVYGNISWTIIFLCGTLNPALFCYRIKEIRKAIHEILRKGSCLL